MLASKLNRDSQQVTTIYPHDIVHFPLFHLCQVHVTVLQLHVILCKFGDFKFQFMRGITTLIYSYSFSCIQLHVYHNSLLEHAMPWNTSAAVAVL